MDLKTLLVTLDADRASESRLAFACRTAQALNARLIGVAAGETMPPALADPYLGGGLATETLEGLRDCVEVELRNLKAQFEATVDARGVPAVWRGRTGSPVEVVLEASAAADLIITGRRSPLCDARAADPGELIVRSGRPVLVAPPVAPREVVGGRILVAWSPAREARLAMTAALPLLRQAREVRLLTVRSEPGSAGVDEALEAQIDWLASHGVAATAESRGSLQEVGDELPDAAAEMDADLIVAGGYGHSRMHEWIMGGVTRALLKDGATGVLFAH